MDMTGFPEDFRRSVICSLKVLQRRFLHDDMRNDMEDLRQIACLATLKVQRKGYDGDSLRRISANEAIAEWSRTYGNRSKWVGQTSDSDFDSVPVFTDAIVDPPPVDERLWKHLTPTMRAILEAVVIDGMSHAAAAEKLGLTVLTVRTTICRAKQRIRAASWATSSQ
jgi:DNA-directed RNA polymerase specialized sigma24 family protein